jgi:L-amino acid N-acyltransferase YncA
VYGQVKRLGVDRCRPLIKKTARRIIMRIREFIPQENAADKAALLPAFLDIWNAPENLPYLSFTGIPFDPETVNMWFDHHLDQGGRYLGAEDDDGRILGIAVIKADPVTGFELFGAGVRAECRRRGIGRALLERGIALAAGLGFKAVAGTVFADNTAMLRLLLAMDFVPVGMEHHKRWDGADTVLLKRCL